MNVYVASSWRNDYQPTVVRELRDAGHEVYDFKNPEWNEKGFHWTEIDGGWESWSFPQYLTSLDHPLAKAGFKSDMDALDWAGACVLVLPCGRSAHLELGWAVGYGKNTCILHQADQPIEPELMAKMCDAQFDSIANVLAWLAQIEGRVGTPQNPHKLDHCKHGILVYNKCAKCDDEAGKGNRIFKVS